MDGSAYREDIHSPNEPAPRSVYDRLVETTGVLLRCHGVLDSLYGQPSEVPPGAGGPVNTRAAVDVLLALAEQMDARLSGLRAELGDF